MAWAYREYLTDQEYLMLESTARARSIGIWSEPDPIYPSDFRRAAKGKSTSPASTQKSYTPTAHAPAISRPSTPSSTRAPSLSLSKQNGASCERKTCGQISTCQEAYHQLNVCGNRRLDRDNDGVPCESICLNPFPLPPSTTPPIITRFGGFLWQIYTQG